jgi:transcriptional regulator with XRE-family HTH domain
MTTENDDLVSSLRDVRVQRGMSVRDLAPLVGVSFTTLAAWERGAIDPPLSKLRTWARALGGIATIVWSDTTREGRPVTMAKMELITTVFGALDDIEDSDAQFLARHIQTIAADRVAVPLAAEPPAPPYLTGPKRR